MADKPLTGCRQLDDPHYLQPPAYFFHFATKDDPWSGGTVECSWGEAFAIIWNTLFHSQKWLTQVLRPLFETYSKNLPPGIYGFLVILTPKGPIFQVSPGSACDCGIDNLSDTVPTFVSHNVDSPAQTLALFTLASLWFSAVVDTYQAIGPSLEDAKQYRYGASPPHTKESLSWEFSNSTEHYYLGDLYRVAAEGFPSPEYYILRHDQIEAQEDVRNALGASLFDNYIHQAERVPTSEYEQLPLLVPVLGTSPSELDDSD